VNEAYQSSQFSKRVVVDSDQVQLADDDDDDDERLKKNYPKVFAHKLYGTVQYSTPPQS
jgi:hypothetical protein